jgi:hypothetical protein
LTSKTETLSNKRKSSKLTIGPDTWAVAVALTLALLVGIGAIKHVPW